LGRFGHRPELSQATGIVLVRCILGKFLGVVRHCFPPLLDVPTFATRCPHVRHDVRDLSGGRWNCGRECCPVIFAEMTNSMPFRDLLHAANLQHGTDGFTYPLRLKHPTASAGFEPANLGTKGQHATPRPPKQLST
jgi:hypothetical protein